MKQNEPTTAEIVKGLHEIYEQNDYGIRQMIDGDDTFIQETCGDAAVRLEQFAEEAFDASARNLLLKQQVKEEQALREGLERELAAAKADIKMIADAVRETHCDETCCFACKYDCDTSINDSGEFNNECPGFDKDDCFEWRGPQAEKGETHE